MISITCTQCRTVLTIDEAFAGGVCRCQHCGTIQTVPAQLKGSAGSTPFVGPSTTTKALYQNKAAAARTGGGYATTSQTSPSGLDDLAQAVVSSGLSGSGLRSADQGTGPNSGAIPATPEAELVRPRQTGAKKAGEKKKPPMMMIAIGGGVLLVGLAVILYLTVFRGKGDKPGGANGAPPVAKGSFCGVPINGTNVVYLIDRANSMNVQGTYERIKIATYHSIDSLGGEGRFAVILWTSPGQANVFYPDKGLINATSGQKDLLKERILNEPAGASTSLRDALELAMLRNPDAIVIVTAKPELIRVDQDEVKQVKDSGKVKLYCFVVTGTDNAFLDAEAAASGGQYKKLANADLPSSE